MECQEFFTKIENTIESQGIDTSRATPGTQCVFEFYHPKIVDIFGPDGLATQFNRSGIVWIPDDHQLSVQLRIPDEYGPTVSNALNEAPIEFNQTDHRGITTSDGNIVTILHFSGRAYNVKPTTLDSILTAISVAMDETEGK
ncbi:MAG: hypothetical protein ABEI86_09240 [Halobacteriaceae archaeon]